MHRGEPATGSSPFSGSTHQRVSAPSLSVSPDCGSPTLMALVGLLHALEGFGALLLKAPRWNVVNVIKDGRRSRPGNTFY